MPDPVADTPAKAKNPLLSVINWVNGAAILGWIADFLSQWLAGNPPAIPPAYAPLIAGIVSILTIWRRQYTTEPLSFSAPLSAPVVPGADQKAPAAAHFTVLNAVLIALTALFAGGRFIPVTPPQPPVPIPSPDPQPPAPSPTLGDMGTINVWRTSRGLKPFTESPCLTSQAINHCHYMQASGEISHDNFTARLNHCSIREGAENVAQGQHSISETLRDWQSSPGHNANLRGDYRTAGIANFGTYWCFITGNEL